MRRFRLIPLALVALLSASTSRQQGQPLLEKIGPNAYDVVADWALPYPQAGYAFAISVGRRMWRSRRTAVRWSPTA